MPAITESKIRQLIIAVLSFAMIAVALSGLLLITAAWQNNSKEPLLGLIPSVVAFLLLLKAYWQVEKVR